MILLLCICCSLPHLFSRVFPIVGYGKHPAPPPNPTIGSLCKHISVSSPVPLNHTVLAFTLALSADHIYKKKQKNNLQCSIVKFSDSPPPFLTVLFVTLCITKTMAGFKLFAKHTLHCAILCAAMEIPNFCVGL